MPGFPRPEVRAALAPALATLGGIGLLLVSAGLLLAGIVALLAEPDQPLVGV
jgi:hypothetical protein